MAKSLKYVQQDLLGWLSVALAALDSVATWCAALVKPRALRQPPRARHRKPTPRKRLLAPAFLLPPVVLMLVSVASWVVLAR
jgi:hypothetical protein